MKIVTPLLLLLFALASCATFDVHFKKEMISGKPHSILIGFFEKRDVSYEPFTAKNFRDAMNYEFFKLGYSARLLKMPQVPDQEHIKNRKLFYALKEKSIAANCAETGSDIFIQGTLMEQVSGDLVSKDYSSTIIVKIYRKDGQQAGEAHYITSKPLSDSRELHKITNEIVTTIDQELK